MTEPRFALIDLAAPCPRCQGRGVRSYTVGKGPCKDCCGTGRRLVPLAEALAPLVARIEELERVAVWHTPFGGEGKP